MRKEILKLPNILCYVRVLLIPLFVYLYLNAQSTAQYYVAAAVLMLSGITDFLDGFIARRFNMVTELGKAIDPIADKLTQGAVAVCLAMKFPLMILLLIVFLVKELSMGTLTLVILKKDGRKLDGALWFGKIATAVFYLVSLALIALPTLPRIWADALILISMACLIFAFVKYMAVLTKLRRESKA